MPASPTWAAVLAGFGSAMPRAFPAGWHVTHTDLSAGMVAEARAHIARAGSSFEVVDAQQLPLRRCRSLACAGREPLALNTSFPTARRCRFASSGTVKADSRSESSPWLKDENRLVQSGGRHVQASKSHRAHCPGPLAFPGRRFGGSQACRLMPSGSKRTATINGKQVQRARRRKARASSTPRAS